VPLVLKRPPLPADAPVDWTHWRDTFTGSALAPQWLQLRDPIEPGWYRVNNGLEITARPDAPGSRDGQPSFVGRRLRQPAASVTARISFTPERNEDFAGLMAFMNEQHFVSIGITEVDGQRRIALRERRSAEQPETGVTVTSQPLDADGPIDLRIAIDGGEANFDWRPAGSGGWRNLAEKHDVEHMASVHAGLFTGTVIGPFAQTASTSP
jgi:alpha-N-arabinofuranosidase